MHAYKLISEDGIRNTDDPDVIKGALVNIKHRKRTEKVTLFIRNKAENTETPFEGPAEAVYLLFCRFVSILNGAMFRGELPDDISAMLTACGR